LQRIIRRYIPQDRILDQNSWAITAISLCFTYMVAAFLAQK
jgi:hypothetical protein